MKLKIRVAIVALLIAVSAVLVPAKGNATPNVGTEATVTAGITWWCAVLPWAPGCRR